MSLQTALGKGISIVAVDTSCTTLVEVEHTLLDLDQFVDLPADATVCTHEVRDDSPHYAVSIALTALADIRLLDSIRQHFAGHPVVVSPAAGGGTPMSIGCRQALQQAREHDGGRAVRFLGWQHLTGTLALHQALATSAIDRVTQLGGGTPAPRAMLTTRDFVRPRWQKGELILAVQPAGANTVAPFEVPNPTQCCAAHP